MLRLLMEYCCDQAHCGMTAVSATKIRLAFQRILFSLGRSDGSHQCCGVDLIGHGSLCHIDDGEKQELRVVEDPKTIHLDDGQGEQHDLDDGDQPHEQYFGGIVNAWRCYFDLLRHCHNGGGDQQ